MGNAELVPTLSPNSVKIDPATGMLQSPHFDGFTIDKKQAFIELIAENPHWGGMREACAKLNISMSNVYRHMQSDTAFRNRLDEAKKLYSLRVEGVLAHQALEPNKTLDRLAYLRAYMPEKYARLETLGPSAVTINIGNDAIGAERERLQAISKEVDARTHAVDVTPAESPQNPEPHA